MNVRVALAALVALLTLPLSAAGQDAAVADDTRLQMEMKRQRAIVHPKPRPEVVEQDIERSEAVRAERRDRIVRELTRREPRRPDLDYSVTSGIQARNLQRLRR